jgi:transcriptional regulator with XRE-family HTH domain
MLSSERKADEPTFLPIRAKGGCRMSGLIERLRVELRDREYREGYDEAYLDHHIATQIRAIREQRGWSQSDLAKAADMKQSRVSAMEDSDYGSWSINTLRRIAYALGVRLRVDFAEWGQLLEDIERSGRADLQRRPFDEDPAFQGAVRESKARLSDDQSKKVECGPDRPQRVERPRPLGKYPVVREYPAVKEYPVAKISSQSLVGDVFGSRYA